MKIINYAIYFIGIFLILSGCTATKRGMLPDNIYFSENYPDIRIEVDPDFKYIKGGGQNYDHIFEGPYYQRVLMIDHHTFHTLENKIDYWNHPQHWIFSDIKSSAIIERGETQLLGKTWYYANLFKEKEDGCYFAKYVRRFTDDQNVFSIIYIMMQQEGNCIKWKNTLSKSVEESEFLEELDQSFEKVAAFSKNSIMQ